MLLLTTTEFRNNMSKYLERAFTEKIALKSKRGIVELSPNHEVHTTKTAVEKDDTLMTKEEFFAKIDLARAQTGGTVIRTKEEMDAFFDSL